MALKRSRKPGIPNRIRHLREERGISQEELARFISISASRLSLVEQAHRGPTNVEREKLARLFALPDAEIFPPQPPAEVTPPTDATT